MAKAFSFSHQFISDIVFVPKLNMSDFKRRLIEYISKISA